MQRFFGVVLGAILTYLLLVILGTISGDTATNYAIAVVAGAIVSLVWPWAIGFILGRRAKSRRNREVRDQVDRQVAEERSKDR
ncbi:MAG: hypothetical protein Q8M74_04910 [Chloroflexota bacterium]|nr:hypothetical protein [Chloroflexota bacterium]